MRDQLLKEILAIVQGAGMDTDLVKNKLVILLSNYEVESRCTEVAILDEDQVTKYLRLFLINKRVSGRTDRTLNHYKNELTRFFNEVRKNPTEVTSDDIKMYLAMKDVRDGVSKVTQKNTLRVISSFYQWMTKEEHIVKNPMNKVDDIKTPKIKKDAFTEEDLEKMRMCIGDDTRLMCMFEMLNSTWCRVSELAQIKLSEISPNKDSVTIHGKGDKDRTCYINARAKICLEKYITERKDDNPFLFAKCAVGVYGGERTFPDECKRLGIKQRYWWKYSEMVGDEHIDKSVIETQIRKLGRKAGVEKAHPHRFRRTGATFALRRGMPIEQVSKLLGHESIETTQIYLDINEKELEQAHRKYV